MGEVWIFYGTTQSIFVSRNSVFSVALQCDKTMEATGRVDPVVSDIIGNKYVSRSSSISYVGN